MNFIVSCDNVGLEGSYVLCILTERGEAFWVNSLNPFRPIASKGICSIADGWATVIETTSKVFYLVALSCDFSIKRAVFLSDAERISSLFSDDKKIYVTCASEIRTFDHGLHALPSAYSTSDAQITGACVIRDQLFCTMTDFGTAGRIVSTSGEIISDSFREPWCPIEINGRLVAVDAITGEIGGESGQLLNVKPGYPRVLCTHGNSLFVFVNLWRRYKRSNFFRGHWDRLPERLANKNDTDAYSSSIYQFDMNSRELIAVRPTTHLWYEASGALAIERLPTSRWLSQDDAGIAALRIRRNLNELGMLRKKIPK